MFTPLLPSLIVAEYDGQKLYHYDIISVFHPGMNQDIFYIVHYWMADKRFCLVPISWASFPVLPLNYLKGNDTWEYYGPADEVSPITIAWPHDTFLANLLHYLQLHFHS